MNEQVAELNRRIAKRFGRDLLGRAHFRVVWGAGETEKRFGAKNVFYGQIFLRSYFGVGEVPKYHYAPERWVLERLTWVPRDMDREVVPLTDDCSNYEPMYFYENVGRPPSEEAVVFTIHCFRNPERYSASDFEAQETAEGEKEEQDIFESLGEDQSIMGQRLESGDAVSYAGLNAKKGT